LRLSDATANPAINHPLLGPGRITSVRELGPLPDNQVAQTIGLMRRRVLEDCHDEGFMTHAARAMSGADPVTQAWRTARNHIVFAQDKELAAGMGVNPDNVIEVIIRPREMAKLIDRGTAAGDCDDFKMYAAALLEAQGIPTSFVTVAADPEEPRQFSHVYLRCYPYPEGRKGNYVALDPSHGPYPGWEVPDMFGKLREWPVDDGWVWVGATAELFAASLFIGFLIWMVAK
jgi:hypothetical protein